MPNLKSSFHSFLTLFLAPTYLLMSLNLSASLTLTDGKC